MMKSGIKAIVKTMKISELVKEKEQEILHLAAEHGAQIKAKLVSILATRHLSYIEERSELISRG